LRASLSGEWMVGSSGAFQHLLEARKSAVQIGLGGASDQRLEQTQQAARPARDRKVDAGGTVAFCALVPPTPGFCLQKPGSI
jgi:hypothetical protein